MYYALLFWNKSILPWDYCQPVCYTGSISTVCQGVKRLSNKIVSLTYEWRGGWGILPTWQRFSRNGVIPIPINFQEGYNPLVLPGLYLVLHICACLQPAGYPARVLPGYLWSPCSCLEFRYCYIFTLFYFLIFFYYVAKDKVKNFPPWFSRERSLRVLPWSGFRCCYLRKFR